MYCFIFTQLGRARIGFKDEGGIKEPGQVCSRNTFAEGTFVFVRFGVKIGKATEVSRSGRYKAWHFVFSFFLHSVLIYLLSSLYHSSWTKTIGGLSIRRKRT